MKLSTITLTTSARVPVLAAVLFWVVEWWPCSNNMVNSTPVPPPTAATSTTNSLGMSRIDFETMTMTSTAGAIGQHILINAFKEPLDVFPDPMLPGLPILFDSSKPGIAYRQNYLGTPNESFGGPGVGEGGAAGSAYANRQSHGKILVISSNENVNMPDANPWGGIISFTFRFPVNIDSMGVIMGQYRNNIEAITADGSQHALQFYGKHFNSYWLVPIKIPNVVQLVFRPQSICAITHINFQPENDKCPVSKVLDFNNLKVGTLVSTVADGITVSAAKESNGEKKTGALVIDTFRPSFNQTDFGAPHNSVNGPGWGPQGRLGLPFENVSKQGNALVVSVDPTNAGRPTPARGGGTIYFTFSPPVYLASLGLLNNVQGASIRATITHRNMTYIEDYITNVGGRNSFQEVFVWAPATRELRVTFSGPGAVTFVKLGSCK